MEHLTVHYWKKLTFFEVFLRKSLSTTLNETAHSCSVWALSHTDFNISRSSLLLLLFVQCQTIEYFSHTFTAVHISFVRTFISRIFLSLVNIFCSSLQTLKRTRSEKNIHSSVCLRYKRNHLASSSSFLLQSFNFEQLGIEKQSQITPAFSSVMQRKLSFSHWFPCLCCWVFVLRQPAPDTFF